MMPLLAAFGSLLLHAVVVTRCNTCQPNMVVLLRVTSNVVHAVQRLQDRHQLGNLLQLIRTHHDVCHLALVDPQGLVLCPHCLSLLMYTVPAR